MLDDVHGRDDDATVIDWLKGAWRRAAKLLDDALPMPSEQRDEREWTPISDEERSDRRKARLKLHMLEKRGKGGYR